MKTVKFELPPRLRNGAGELRTVGIEVEFGGLSVDEACDLVVQVFGGAVEVTSRFSSVVRGARLGDWQVEIDSKLLTQQGYRDALTRVGASEWLTGALEDMIETVARIWIPTEIATPPIGITHLRRTEALRVALARRHAKGTGASPLYMFGLHLNPEIPTLDAPTITRYLQAFLALFDWLVKSADIDFTRRLSSFVDPYPQKYRALVLSPSYAPDMERLIDDYLTWNPTRNRALDLLPAFCHIAPDTVLARVEAPHMVNARPTFHYRLPDSHVDRADWSFALEWNRWVVVERLAEDPARLRALCDEVLAQPDSTAAAAAGTEVAVKQGQSAS